MTNAWRDVEQGRRRLDWMLCLGDTAAADHITTTGREVARRAANDLEAFFGVGWLHHAAHPATPELMPSLSQFWPALNPAPSIYIAAIGLWAQVQLLVTSKVQGIGKIRENIRTNPVRDEFRHFLGQTRLAAQAHLAGAHVVLEPDKPVGGPGDLSVTRRGARLFIEFRGLNPPKPVQGHEAHTHETIMFLRMLETSYNVHWSGGIPDEATSTWKQQAMASAELCSKTHDVIPFHTVNSTLVVAPGPAPTGTMLTGPLLEHDQEKRLLHALTKKAQQTASAGAAWVWLEDDNALWPMTNFARFSLREKVSALTTLLSGLFAEHPHLLGVVLTSGINRITGPANMVVNRPNGAGVMQVLPDGRVRESVILHRRLLVPDQYALALELTTDEPLWLDKALRQLGIAGGLASLTMGAISTAPGPNSPLITAVIDNDLS